MSVNYYGLVANPFSKHFNTSQNCFQSHDFKQATGMLNHLKDIRGLGILTAPTGMGKSLALKYFTDSLNPNLYKSCYICMTTVSITEFYRMLCDEIGITDVSGKSGRFNAIKDQIRYMYKEKRQTFIMIIDEAQHLNTNILTDLKMLMNFECDTVNYFALVLSGEPHLTATLSKPVHQALRERVVARYKYSGLLDSEVKEYVLHKIAAAQGSESIIEPAAISTLHSYSQGNARIIDSIMTDALVIGEQQKKKVIDSEVILAAAENRVM